MANIGTELKNWSTTEASNQPDSTDATTLVGDLRAIQTAVRYIYSQDTIASATTCDLGSKTAGSLTISGTTTITGLGTVSAGIRKSCVFSGALTLTHNATSLILPGGANITTAANDRAEFESLGSGNWRCNWYVKADGTAIFGINSASITGQSAETSPAIDDLLLISDTSESAALNKMTFENFFKVINGLTEDTSPDSNADYLLAYDTSASGVKKVLLGRANASIGTATAASGTAVEFTGIPSWARQITLSFSGLSTNGTANLLVQIGDSGGFEATGYLGSCIANGTTVAAFTTGFGINSSTAATVLNGSIIITIIDSTTNLWAAYGNVGRSDSAFIYSNAGSKALTATLDRIRIATGNGTDTFDAGTVNIVWS